MPVLLLFISLIILELSQPAVLRYCVNRLNTEIYGVNQKKTLYLEAVLLMTKFKKCKEKVPFPYLI